MAGVIEISTIQGTTRETTMEQVQAALVYEPLRIVRKHPAGSSGGEAVDLVHLFKNSDTTPEVTQRIIMPKPSPARASLCHICFEMSYYTFPVPAELLQVILQHLPVQVDANGQLISCAACSQTVERFHSLFQHCLVSHQPNPTPTPAVQAGGMVAGATQGEPITFTVAVDMRKEEEELKLMQQTDFSAASLPSINCRLKPFVTYSDSFKVRKIGAKKPASNSQSFQIKLPKPSTKKKSTEHSKTQKMILFPCVQCCANFDTLALLQGHCSKEHDIYLCSLCGDGSYFKSSLEMQNHLSAEHTMQFSCPICDTSFLSKGRLATHISLMHEDSQGFVRSKNKIKK